MSGIRPLSNSHFVFETDVAARNSVERNGGRDWRSEYQVQQESPNTIKNHDPQKIQVSNKQTRL